MSSPRILLSAYQCAPGLGSVSQIGWEWYSRLARRTRVTLVTHSRNRVPLENAGAPLAGSEVIYIDTEWFAGPLYRISSKLFSKSQHAVFLISSIDFYFYDWQALRTLRKHSPTQWDLIHAPTPVSPLAATRLFRLGLPLIVGPWNGGMSSPPSFAHIMREEALWMNKLRPVGRFIDRVVGCTRNATLILSASKITDQCIPPSSRGRVRRMIENGVDSRVFSPGPTSSLSNLLRILFVGRLIPVKGISMLLEAISQVRTKVNLKLTIVGDGPIRARIETEISKRDLHSVVTLTGHLSLEQVARAMQTSDLLCLPSIRESGGAVLLEAMACALPVVAVNYGGPSEIVDGEVGALLSRDGPEAVIAGMVAVFQDAFLNPTAWRARGLAGCKRVGTSFGWEAKVDTAMRFYEEALATGITA